MIPSQDEAFAAIGDVIYVMEQCLTHHLFVQEAEPILRRNNCASTQQIRNATLESSLLFIRKLNEFFTVRQQRFDNDLRAYHFGEFKHIGWFLEEHEVKALNLHVAHLSVEGVRHGKQSWPIDNYVLRALDQFLLFLDFLLHNPDTPETRRPELASVIEQYDNYSKRLDAALNSGEAG